MLEKKHDIFPLFFFFLFFNRELLELIKILFLKVYFFLSLLFPNLVEGVGRCYFLSISVGWAFLSFLLTLKQKIIKILENMVNLKIFHIEP